MRDIEDDENDFSSDADEALITATEKAEDEFDFSSDADDALVDLLDQSPPLKRKADEQLPQSAPAKRSKSYPETSQLARQVLKETFGLEAFRLKQEQAIARLLDGGSATVVIPTGGGKSLCYQV